jgi:hypothetical protein
MAGGHHIDEHVAGKENHEEKSNQIQTTGDFC